MAHSTRRSQAKSMVSYDNGSLHISPTPEGDQASVNSKSSSSVLVKVEDSTPPPECVELTYGWQHPAELEYITPEHLSTTDIIFHLISNSFSIPARIPGKNKNPPLFKVSSVSGQKTMLPVGYRIPLLFLARFQWMSLRLVLTASSRQSEWSDYKFGILHVCRLYSALFNAAQEQVRISNNDGISRGMDRKWRCPTFDRAITRYRLRWFLSIPSQVKEFWETYREDEYAKDPLKFDWRRWAVKGHCGFALTDAEINDGITAEQFMSGLKRKNDDWFWTTNEDPVRNGIDAWSLRDVAMSSSILPLHCSTREDVSTQLPPSQISEPVETTISAAVVASKPLQLEAITTATSLQILPSSFCDLADSEVLDTAMIIESNIDPPSSTTDAHPITLPPSLSSQTLVVPTAIPTGSATTSALAPKTIPQKRPGSPLQKDSILFFESNANVRSSTNARSKSTSYLTTSPHPFRGAKYRRFRTIHASSRAKPQSISVPPMLSCANGSFISSEPAAQKDSDHMVIDPPRVESNVEAPRPSSSAPPVSNSASSSTLPILFNDHNRSPTPPPLHPQPMTSSTLPIPSTNHSTSTASSHPQPASYTEHISPEAMTQVIDSLFIGFAESLRRFSNEILRAKAEGVAEIQELVSGQTLQPILAEMVRDIMREEVRTGIQEELASVRNDILQDNKRELRDGVRVVVAAMRQELVEDMQGNFRDLRTGMGQLKNQFLQRVVSLRTERIGKARRSTFAESETVVGNMLTHPLQHLLGGLENDPTEDESCGDLEYPSDSVDGQHDSQAIFSNTGFDDDDSREDEDGDEDEDRGEDEEKGSLQGVNLSDDGVVHIRSRRKVLGF